MSLILKALKQIDSRLPPIAEEREEPIVPAQIAPPQMPTAAFLETPSTLTRLLGVQIAVEKPAAAVVETQEALLTPKFSAFKERDEITESAAAIPKLPVAIDDPLEIAEPDWLKAEAAISEEAVSDILDPLELTPFEPALQPLESISLDALFAVPFQPAALVALPSPLEAPAAAIEASSESLSPALLMTATVNETTSEPALVVTDSVTAVEEIIEEISNLEELLTVVNEEAEIVSVIESPPVALPPLASLPWESQPVASQPLKLSDEYRELRDHFLSRFTLQRHATLLLIDAGRSVTDAAWLTPFAASLLEHLGGPPRDSPTQQQMKLFCDQTALPTALLVEAAGADCGLARSFGVDARIGLSDVLRGEADWKTALRPTIDPQIQLLSRGSGLLAAGQERKLTSLWAELKANFDLLLVAVGPLHSEHKSKQSSSRSPAAIFLPLASAAVLCVELDGTPQPGAMLAKHKLSQSGVNLLGCIVRGDAAAA